MALDASLLAQLAGAHPARRMSYDELRAGLMRGVEQGTIVTSREGDLELYGYTSTCQFDQRWDLFSLIARGLILDTAQRRVVATPFPKFFNFNEGGVPLPKEPFEAAEKIDGSLGILFHHNGRWRASTRGRLDSPQGQWATEHLNRHVATDALVPGATYLAEIVYPENRIVIPYDFAGLVLLAAYDEEGHELSRPMLEATAAASGMRVARAFASTSFDDLIAVAQKLSRNEEGFVVRFVSGLRVKLKGEAYCLVHKLISRCTPIAVWDAMMNGEDLDRMRRDLPEEMRADFDAIRTILRDRFEALVGEVAAGHKQSADLSDKELGLMLNDRGCALTDAQRKFAFARRHKGFLTAVHQPGEWRRKAFNLLRPDRNHLAGYVPSNAMTRFEAEAG